MIICMVLRLVFRKKCKVFSLISFLCPQRVKHFTLTMCIRIATQYEKSWQNNRIYLQVYPHVHTKLYTGRFSRKVQYFFGSDSSGHWKKKLLCNMYQFRLDNGDLQPWPWEKPRERKKFSQRLDSLKHDQVLIAQHKRNFHFTRAGPNPCIQVWTGAFMPFAVCRVRFYRSASSHTFRYKPARHSKPG